MILLSNSNLRVLSVMKVQMQCRIRKREDGFFMGRWCWEGATLQSMDDSSTCPVALALWFCPAAGDTDGMISSGMAFPFAEIRGQPF